MLAQILWFLFWPFSQLIYSPEDLGIEPTTISWKWSGLIIGLFLLLILAIFLRLKFNLW